MSYVSNVDGFGVPGADLFRAGVDLDCHVNGIVASCWITNICATEDPGRSQAYGGMVITGAADCVSQPRGPSGLPRCDGPPGDGQSVGKMSPAPFMVRARSETAGSSTAWKQRACSRVRKKRCRLTAWSIWLTPSTGRAERLTPHPGSVPRTLSNLTNPLHCNQSRGRIFSNNAFHVAAQRRWSCWLSWDGRGSGHRHGPSITR